jgi:cardiolipin synthase
MSGPNRPAAVLRLLPNLLSLSRAALGLAFPWLPPNWRGPVVAFAALSDLADGALSRGLGATGTLGRVLDPVADKLFVLAVVLTLLAEGRLRGWEVALVGLRDWAVLLGAAGVALRRDWAAFRHMPPTLLGKAVTVLQFVFLLLVLFAGGAGGLLFALTAALSGLAALDYLRIFWAARKGSPRP